MYLLSDLDLSLPLKNPVVIFSLVLFIILFAPILLNRLKIPHIIGLILAGVVIGPYGLNLLLRDSSIVLFGTVGLLYIMFSAGLEIDLEEFRKNRIKSLVFGLITFIVPMLLGSFGAFYVLQFSLPSSLLLASMFAAHTLLAYPVASKYGVARQRSVTMTVGGTIIADVLALLVLAGVTGMTRGEISTWFWLKLLLGTMALGGVIFFIFPLIARWFFKNHDDHISQYIFVLAMVFLGAFLAELAGLEAIVGAFLSGLTLNRFIPHSSALMNRIDFVGNAFFIPFFLISVGMLVDFSVLLKGWGAIIVAAVMTIIAVSSKYLAAWITQKTFRLKDLERSMIFGLSTARVGATLAVVLVGYNIIIGETAAGEPLRLLNEDVLNGTVLMILITCTISSFVVEKASQKMALTDEQQAISSGEERLMVCLPPDGANGSLLELALAIQENGKAEPVYALHIISDEQTSGQSESLRKKIFGQATAQALAAGRTIAPVTRYDSSEANGIVYAAQEYDINGLLLPLSIEMKDAHFHDLTVESVIRRNSGAVYAYHAVQPVNTLEWMIVAVPPKAELEPGFNHWIEVLVNIAKHAALSIRFYTEESTAKEIGEWIALHPGSIKASYHPFSNWEDFLVFSSIVKQDHLLVVIGSRKSHVSWNPAFEKINYYFARYFSNRSLLLIYPNQLDLGVRRERVDYTDSALAGKIVESVQEVGKMGNLFRRWMKRRQR